MLGLDATATYTRWKMWFFFEFRIMEEGIATAHHATPAVWLRYQRGLAFIFDKTGRAVISTCLDVFVDTATIRAMKKFWAEPKICSYR